MANNDEYTDEYNDEYLCRDFFGRGYHSRYQNFEFTGFTCQNMRIIHPTGIQGPETVSIGQNILYSMLSACF